MNRFYLDVLLSDVQELIKLQQYYKISGARYKNQRFLVSLFKQDQKAEHITGISGLRGSGKTVMLYQLLRQIDNSFYVSADSVHSSLFDIAKYLKEHLKIKTLLIDEIHYAPEWSRDLKKIYDILQLKVYFTSSVSLDILQAREDLTRRVFIFNVPPLSLREYLLLKYNEKYEVLDFEDVVNKYQNFATVQSLDYFSRLEDVFIEYLQHPLPSLLKQKTEHTINNIIDKVVSQDLDNVIDLDLTDKRNMRVALRFLATIKGGDISISQLAKNLGVTKHKMQSYLELLEKAFIVHLVPPYGKNVLAENKVLLNLPFRNYLSLEYDILRMMGTFKEDFLISMLKPMIYACKNYTKYLPQLFYLKTSRGKKTPDFLFLHKDKKYIIEVGGSSKKYDQFKGISAKDNVQKFVASFPYFMDLAKRNDYKSTQSKLKVFNIPLVLFGMLW